LGKKGSRGRKKGEQSKGGMENARLSNHQNRNQKKIREEQGPPVVGLEMDPYIRTVWGLKRSEKKLKLGKKLFCGAGKGATGGGRVEPKNRQIIRGRKNGSKGERATLA